MRQANWLPVCCLCLGVSSNVLGQQPAVQGRLKDTEFVIQKERKHVLPEAARLFTNAPFVPLVTDPAKSLEYTLRDLGLVFDILPRKINVFPAQQVMLDKLYNNYVRNGYGNFHALFLEGFLAGKHHPKYTYDLRVSHQSAGHKTHFSETHNLIQIYGKLFTETLLLGGNMSYHRSHYPLYPPEGTATQTLHQVSIDKTLGNYLHEMFGSQVSATFNYLVDAYQVRERHWEFHGKGDYALNDTLTLKAFTDLCLTKHSDTAVVHRNLWRVKPLVSSRMNTLDVQGGVNVVYQNDIAYTPDVLHLYPVVEVKYTVYDWLQPYLRIGGDIQQNTLRSFVQENPLLASQIDLRHTNQRFVLYGGAQGNLAAQIHWHARFSVGRYHNLYCLVNSAQDSGRFQVKYDSAATLTHTFGELSYTNLTETLTTRLRGDYFQYTLQELAKPWHRPRYQLELCSDYSLYDKYIFRGTLYWLGGIEALDRSTQTSIMLEDVVEIDVGLEYLLSSRFSVFLDCKNVLARKNERYLRYPAHGFCCMLGLIYTW